MDVKIENIEVGKAYYTEEVHFSGGLRGYQVQQGWALGPTPAKNELRAFLFATPAEHAQFARECGVHFIGTCIKSYSENSHVPGDVWEPGPRDVQNGMHAADSWATIAYRAREAGDIEYADCASYISVCSRIAGLRLRDVSNGYHDQLRWALLEQTKVGAWFANTALLDLYADFHSLVSELCSARDYLAKLAGIHAGANSKIDSLARLEEWAKKPTNSEVARQPLIDLLLSALGISTNPGWLRRLGEIRNEMLHRVPMARSKSASGLILQEVETRFGPIRTIRLAQPLRERHLSEQGIDPLVELSDMSMKFEQISRAAWKFAKYPPKLADFGSGLT